MSDESLRSIIGRVKAVSDAKRKQLEADGVAPPRGAPQSPPACAYCNERGWYTLSVDVEDPRFGKSYSCACQAEKLASDRLRRLRIYSNLGSLTRFTFDTLDDNRPTPANAQAFSSSRVAAQDYSKKPFRLACLPRAARVGKDTSRRSNRQQTDRERTSRTLRYRL